MSSLYLNATTNTNFNAHTFNALSEIAEMLPGILNQLGAESFSSLKKLASTVAGKSISNITGLCKTYEACFMARREAQKGMLMK